MSKFTFKKASKEKLKLKMAIGGVSGGGKTYSALRIARNLVGPKGRIAVIDTERDSARLYAPKPGEAADEAKGTFEFDHLSLESCHPRDIIEAMKAAEAEGYDVVILDSMSAAWNGRGGLLEEVDKIGARMGSKFNAWGPAGQMQNEMVDTILALNAHVIVTLRSKMEYVQEKDDRNKTVVRKVGLKVVQRDDTEYEFTVFATMDQDNVMKIEKTRCKALNPDQKHNGLFRQPGAEFAKILSDWLDAGGEPEPKAPAVNWKEQADMAIADIVKMDAEKLELFKGVLAANFPKGEAPDAVRREIGAAVTKRERELQG